MDADSEVLVPFLVADKQVEAGCEYAFYSTHWIPGLVVADVGRTEAG